MSRSLVKNIMCLFPWLMRLRRLHILPGYLKERQLAKAPLDSLPGSLRQNQKCLLFVGRVDRRLDSSLFKLLFRPSSVSSSSVFCLFVFCFFIPEWSSDLTCVLQHWKSTFNFLKQWKLIFKISVNRNGKNQINRWP